MSHKLWIGYLKAIYPLVDAAWSANTLIAGKKSSQTGLMFDAGRTKPWLPVSANSTVYAYLIPMDFAQSSEPPVSRKLHYIAYLLTSICVG